MKGRRHIPFAAIVILIATSVLPWPKTAWPASDEDVFRYRAYPNLLIVLNRSASMATVLDNSSLDLDGDLRFTRYDLALKSLFRVLNADGNKDASYGASAPDYAAAVSQFRSLITVEDELYLSQRIGVLWYDSAVHHSTPAPFQVQSPPTTPNQPPYGDWSYKSVWDNVYALTSTSPLPLSGTTASFPKSDIASYFSYATSNPAADSSASCRPKVILLITDGSDMSGAGWSSTVLDNTYSMFILGIGVSNPGDRNKLRRLITRNTSAVDETADETGGAGRIAFFSTPNDVETSAIFQNMVAQLQSSTFEFVAPVVPAVRTSDANRLFVASFTPATGSGVASAMWPGHLRSFDLNADGSIPDPLVQNWDAATRLGFMSSSARNLYTSVGGTRREFLDNPSSGVTAADLGVSSADLSGVISQVRGLGLGDIFHSTPVFVGSPSPYYADLGGLDARQEFVANNAHRKRIIVAGANDGMLHAFNAGVWNGSTTPPAYDGGDGDEEWAYLPGFLLGKVKNFYQYPAIHNYYVDSTPAVADIWVDSNSDHVDAHTVSEWHTYLIGGAGKGGNGYFALDITDPDDPKVQWELTKAQTSYLGQTWSTPAIGKIRKVVTISQKDYGYDQWVAVVGGGKGGSAGATTLDALADLSPNINNPYTISVASTGDAPSSGAITLSVTLYERQGSKWVYNTYTATGSYTSKTAISFDNVTFPNNSDKKDYPASTTTVFWTDPGVEGKAILVLDAGSGQILQTLTHASMGQVVAPPAILNDPYGYIERVYMGDLSGNIWRSAVDNTGVFSLGGDPFFAITGSTYSKQIFSKTSLAKGSGAYPYWWIYFGTGDRNDPMGGMKGAVFGVFDSDMFTRHGMTTTTKTEGNLANATTFLANVTDSSASFPTLGANDKGWFGELPVVAEKMLSNPTVFNSNLFFTTFEPNTGDCSIGGTARVYGFGIVPGYNAGNYALFASSTSSSADTRILTLSNVGIPSSPVVSVSSTGVATMYLGTTGSSVKALKIPSPTTNKSIRYWKEVF
ncbi:MAG TPA: PilC/PilY family type IV pilus protein [Candidatus Deferrimicrobiaceae bacterium]|nr:PilC/PilY family type IV pilus protein [Candidatus Deferrimicrobiaceae bacterium]